MILLALERERLKHFPNIHTILTILIWPPTASHSGSSEENWHLIYTSCRGKIQNKIWGQCLKFLTNWMLVRSTKKKSLFWHGNPKEEKSKQSWHLSIFYMLFSSCYKQISLPRVGSILRFEMGITVPLRLDILLEHS